MRHVVEQAIISLERMQSDDGSYLGEASADSKSFSSPRIHQTAFFTSLIVRSLRETPGTRIIRSRGAEFILTCRTAEWTWNYWVPGSEESVMRPFPDDLDDTAYALLAVSAADSANIGGESLAKFAHHLIRSEKQVGGPYRTWLVDDYADDIWRDTDIAVNANIAAFLDLNAALPEKLEAYIAQAVSNRQLTSKYYRTSIPVIYFIASWYRGSAVHELIGIVKDTLNSVDTANPLHVGMLITSCCHLGLVREAQLLMGVLIQLRSGRCWEAAALYDEPSIDGVPYVAGSKALSTAFAIEAMNAVIEAETSLESAPKKHAVSFTSSIVGLEPEMKEQYQHYMQRLITNDKDGKIHRIATLTETSSGKRCRPGVIRHLNSGSMHGWASYTIVDDILDDDSQATLLPLAMIMLRKTVDEFKTALPGNNLYGKYVDSILNRVDAANMWEQRHACADVQTNVITIAGLPDYSDLAQLADRSYGYSLAGAGVLVALGEKIGSKDFRRHEDFYHHYLIAKQLNDDAHDWYEDLMRGHLSYAGVLTLRSFTHRTKDISIDMDDENLMLQLKRHYWEECIPRIVSDIENHISIARRNLQECRILTDNKVFAAWLDQLERSARAASQKRQESQDFIASFLQG